MPIALIAIAGLAAYFLFFQGGKGISPNQRPAQSATDVANAVQIALLNETDPAKLDEFANSLQPDYANYATQLHAKAALLRAAGGGGALPPPGVIIPAIAPAPAATPLTFAIWSLSDYEALHPDVQQYLDNSTPPHGLRVDQKIRVFFHDAGGGAIPVPCNVDDPDPNASTGYVGVSVDSQVPGGPKPGSKFHLSTTNEDDMYLDDDGTAAHYLAHGGANT